MKNKAFTLAEIMIVLTVVGILTAILLPAALQSAPDENVMKFKKANSTLGTIIRELVNSDKYYFEGDLGVLPSGALVTNVNYFCRTFADMVSVKVDKCTGTANSKTAYRNASSGVDAVRGQFDSDCNFTPTNYLTTADGVSWFEASNSTTFGAKNGVNRIFNGTIVDSAGFDSAYKTICLDVDQLGGGETPFGFGIRADGKIAPGTKAMDWINRSIQKGD